VNLPLLGARVLRDESITLDPHNFCWGDAIASREKIIASLRARARLPAAVTAALNCAKLLVGSDNCSWM